MPLPTRRPGQTGLGWSYSFKVDISWPGSNVFANLAPSERDVLLSGPYSILENIDEMDLDEPVVQHEQEPINQNPAPGFDFFDGGQAGGQADGQDGGAQNPQAAGQGAAVPPQAVAVPPQLMSFAQHIIAFGRAVSYSGDTVILLPTADTTSPFPAVGGTYTLVNGVPKFTPFPVLSAPAPSTAQVRLHSDELVTFDGKKRGPEAEAFLFLAKQLVLQHKLPVDQYAIRMFTDEARAWYVKLLQVHHSKGTVITWDDIWREFAVCFTYDRNHNWEVRQNLMSRRYVQKSEQSVASYMVQFRHIVMLATDLSETDQVSWFLAGLLPEIAAECQTDLHNKPFTVLQELYESAKSVELKLISLGKRTVYGFPAPVSMNRKPAQASRAAYKPRAAGIQKSSSKARFPANSSHTNSDKGPAQGSSGRFKSRAGRNKVQQPAFKRPANNMRTKPLSAELKTWLAYCYHGRRCHRCGQPGHEKMNCRSPTSLAEPDWPGFMSANPNQA